VQPLLTVMSAKSHGFKKWWLRCLNLNTTSVSWSQRTCEAISDACWHITPGTVHQPNFYNVLLNECILLKVLSLLLPGFSSSCVISQLLLAEGLLRKPLACLCPWIDYSYSLCFLLVQPLITPLTTFVDMPKAGSGPKSGSEETCLANWSAMLFPSNPHVSEHPYQLTPQLYVKQQSGTSHTEIWFQQSDLYNTKTKQLQEVCLSSSSPMKTMSMVLQVWSSTANVRVSEYII
jgi:hypothetical protein